MRPTDYKQTINPLKEAAGRMWQHVIAKCPDDHLQEHLAEARKVARAKGFEFNRIVWEGDHYGFFIDDTPVAVIIKRDDHYDIGSDYRGDA